MFRESTSKNGLRIAFLLLGCAAIVGPVAEIPALGQVRAEMDTGVFGQNVARVDFEGGSFRQLSATEWGEYDSNGSLLHSYAERSRDDWAVYFWDESRRVNVHIDFLYGVIFQTAPGSTHADQRATITTATPNAAMPRVALPKPPVGAEEWFNKRFMQPAPSAPRVAQSVTAPPPWQGQEPRAVNPVPRPDPTQSNNGWDTPQNGSQQQNNGNGVQQSSGQPQGNGWGNQQGNSQQQGSGWGNQQGNNQQQGNGWGNQQDSGQQQSGGWGNSAPTTAPAPAAAPRSNPPWASNRGSEQSAPPWQSQGGQGSGIGQGQPQQQEQDLAELYSGHWVQRDFLASQTGDGINQPVTWTQPKILSFERIDANTLMLRSDAEPVAMARLTKQGENVFAGQGTTARFSKAGKSYYLALSGAGSFNGSFEFAKTPAGQFSKDRFATSTQTDRSERFSLDGIVREWNNNLFGYDGLLVNLDRVRVGQKTKVFKQPGPTDLAMDDSMNQVLPFGLRGARLNDSALKMRESVITDASEYQRSYSLNFGSGSQFGSTSTSMEFTNGRSISMSNLRAVSYASAERYVLMIDKPNNELSDSFRQSVEQLANGDMDPTSFIGRFGTHYAQAITYGGIAKAEKTMTSEEIKTWSSSSVNTSVGGAFKGVSASIGGGTSNSQSKMKGSVFTAADFAARGGTGTASLESWQVDDSNTVPVRYDLRPLSELISPVFFKSGADQAKASRYNRARTSLANAIAAHMATARLSDEKLIAYELEVVALRCTSDGDDSDGIAEMTGNIVLKRPPGSNILDTNILQMRSERKVYCNGVGKVAINQTFTISNPNEFQFRIAAENLVENDPTAFDVDEKVNRSSDQYFINIAQEARGKSWIDKTVTFSGDGDAPRLVVDYRIRKMF